MGEKTMPGMNVTTAEVSQAVGLLCRAVADATIGPATASTPEPDYQQAMTDFLAGLKVLGIHQLIGDASVPKEVSDQTKSPDHLEAESPNHLANKPEETPPV
jgi:hypothetical protein